jgi:hypothetical protein
MPMHDAVRPLVTDIPNTPGNRKEQARDRGTQQTTPPTPLADDGEDRRSHNAESQHGERGGHEPQPRW